MKAAVLYERGTPFKLEEVRLDPPKKHEVLVKIAAAGVCRSDYHILKDESSHPVPAVLGHEGSGIVEAIGEDVTMVKPGDHVILSFVPNCGHCFQCETGNAQLCDTHGATPGTMFDGTTRIFNEDGKPLLSMGKVACFAEYAVVPDAGCIPIASDIPLDVAALIGFCVPTGVGAATHKAKVEPGSTVAVLGCGGVGLNAVQGARLSNASKIIAIDIFDHKLEFTYKFGATHTINAKAENPVEKVMEITEGRGVDYAIEAYGSAETVENAFNMVRKGGKIVVVGLAPKWDRASIDPQALTRNERSFIGSYYGSVKPRQDMPKMVSMYLEGKLDIEGLIQRRYSLDQINDAFVDLENGEDGRGVILF